MSPVELPGDAPVSILAVPQGGVLVGGGYYEGLMRLKSQTGLSRATGLVLPNTAFPTNRCGLYLIRNGAIERTSSAVHTDSVTSLAVVPDPGTSIAAFASGSADGVVKWWGPDLKELSPPLVTGYDPTLSMITCLRFSKDAKTLFAAVSVGLEPLSESHLLAFDLSTGHMAWNVNLGSGVVVAMHGISEGSMLLQIDRSPSSLRTESHISSLQAIGPDGRNLRVVADGFLARIRALGVDAMYQVHVLDELSREHTIPTTTADVVGVLRTRHGPIAAEMLADSEEQLADQAVRDGNPARERFHIEAALRADPQSIGLRMRLAKTFFDAGEASNAEILYNAVIETWPHSMLARCQRGLARMALSRFSDAELDFTRAMENQSDLFQPTRRLDSPSGILALLDSVGRLSRQASMSSHLKLLELRASARTAQGKGKEALEDLTAAIEGGRRTPSAYLLRSRVFEMLGDPTRATADAITARDLQAERDGSRNP